VWTHKSCLQQRVHMHTQLHQFTVTPLAKSTQSHAQTWLNFPSTASFKIFTGNTPQHRRKKDVNATKRGAGGNLIFCAHWFMQKGKRKGKYANTVKRKATIWLGSTDSKRVLDSSIQHATGHRHLQSSQATCRENWEQHACLNLVLVLPPQAFPSERSTDHFQNT